MVSEIENMIMLKENFMKAIKECRDEIADLREKRAIKKAPLWEEATGTVDAKKDYIKSKIADIDCEIAKLEADIELYYNQISILDDKIQLEYLTNE